MASSFSTLKFELIATGEQSGSWGTTTNNNLSVALTEAIAGTVDVAFSSGNVTLTLSDTVAAQQARNLRLNLTGTSGGARDLIVPAIEKSYLINNGTADIITVKNPSTSGVPVAPGKTTWVYNDGTTVLNAVTYLTSLTFPAATSLALTDGGTGAVTALAARTNLEVGITKEGTAFASATSPTVPTDGNYFDVSATNTITSFTVAANRHFFCNFLAAATLAHNDPNLELPGGANITAAAGDVAEFFSTATDDVQCINYTKADGTAVVASAGGGPSVGTNAIIRTNATNMQDTLTLSDHLVTYTAVHGDETLSVGTDQDFANGDTVQLTGTDLPNGWFIDTQYFVVSVASATMKLSLTFGGAAVAISDNGSGTNQVYQNINGMTAGPITQDSGTTTIPSGSTWSII